MSVFCNLVEINIEYAVASALYWWGNLSARGGAVNKYAIGITKEDVYNVSWCVNGRKIQETPYYKENEPNGMKDRWEKFEKISKILGLIK